MIKKTFLMLTVLLVMCAMVGCSSDDNETTPSTYVTNSRLCGCSWTPGAADFLSFFEDGTFEEYTYMAGWRYLYKGTWSLKAANGEQTINATYTSAYENGTATELKDHCRWSGSKIFMSNDGETLYIGDETYSKTTYVSPNTTQFGK